MKTENSKRQERQIRSINPLGMRVVVKILKDENQTDSGLYLPEQRKADDEDSLLGQVIEVATAADEDFEDEEANISGLPLGAHVLIPRTGGVKVPWDDTLRIVETADVLAIVSLVDVI